MKIHVDCLCHSHSYKSPALIKGTIDIREYGSTLYVGMAPKQNCRPYKSLVIYTNRF